ncbi:MAG: ATP-binding protein [Clostridium sp.]|uniref:ATP-binding protein n=1 Tax=Clostridium sp. TaxID=1506 RepID=UPI003F31543D
MKRIVYPFTGIIGQEEMKEGLIINAVNTNVGGLLVFGEKGTAKSTALRGFGNLLPDISVVKGCRFGCDIHDKENLCIECRNRIEKGEVLEEEFRKMKVVELPIGVTEDRVVGSLDIEEALKTGEKRFEIGILGEANRGILYVDEINLLDDNIVDLLLDSAAMGVNTVEREGVSFSHPAKFILVATMNPEEGELRPQLLDRFGLSVQVKGIRNPEERIKVIKNRGEFDKDPNKFLKEFEPLENELREKIIKARNIVRDVEISDELLLLIAKIGIKFDIDGHRGDLTLMKTAMTIAALDGRKEVKRDDILKAAPLVLFHRMRKLPFEVNRELTMDDILQAIEEV